MRGLIGRSALLDGEGLLLKPAPSIHTGFMRFPIDAVFLDADLQVVRIVENLRPWRMASARHARAVLELAAGECARRGFELGDQLRVLDQAAQDETSFSASTSALAGSARVLLVGSDRRFRGVTSALLTRRGWSVSVEERHDDLAERAARAGADVIVLDATPSLTAAASLAAKLQQVRPPIGIVVVSGAPEHGLAALPVLPKWGSFDSLCAAIEHAHAERTELGATT